MDKKLFAQHRRAETLQDALDGTMDFLEGGRFLDFVEGAFDGSYGPEPVLSFKIRIRRDAKRKECFTYSVGTSVSHDLGKHVSLHELEQ